MTFVQMVFMEAPGSHLRCLADMFDVYDIKNEEEANRKIAYRLAEMQRMYNELIQIAQAWDIRLDFDFNDPEGMDVGQNKWQGNGIVWNPSSTYC